MIRNIKEYSNRLFIICLFILSSFQGYIIAENGSSMSSLANQFVGLPSDKYKPYVWWHWMGSNFSKEGITKDLEAMKEAGIAGATIFNLTSAVQETQAPIENNPWPHQTFRSEYYWDALKHAASEAKRLGLKIGLQSTPGYSTTGGPWISEERGMQRLVSSVTAIEGGKSVRLPLNKPELPVFQGWGSSKKRATYYKDIAVIAVPEDTLVASVSGTIDLSDKMDAAGMLNWNAPQGKWKVYRIGHAPTMANPHPLPDDLIGKALEVDKMSREQNVYHWTMVLEPLKEYLGEYIGTSFTHILIDSYEADYQDWTPTLRKEFIRMKGYDPLPWIALKKIVGDREDTRSFTKDFHQVVNRLFMDNGWKVGKQMINDAGLQMIWEPYEGPFDSFEAATVPDIPMGEFWTGGNGSISQILVKAAHESGKNIIAAEAFTGRPEISQYTEDPAFLKRSADGSFTSGVNMLFLHHWVHQPFDERYQPGMGMGWWGTHFGRNQTWIKPGKAFFTYLARCQMLLQQGKPQPNENNMIHRSTGDAEIFFVTNSSKYPLKKTFSFPVNNRKPELWQADDGTIKNASDWRESENVTFVDLDLEADQSIFVVFPKDDKLYSSLKSPVYREVSRSEQVLSGAWEVKFSPKLRHVFEKSFAELIDFSESSDPNIKYFAGTAVYEKQIRIDGKSLAANKRILLDLGELNDIAELSVNGKQVSVLWYPPYRTDITSWLRKGKNTISIAITNNWANRLIGDEQEPEDFEWGQDRGVKMGRAMKAFPDWFTNNTPRPSKKRVGFVIWNYHRKDSPLQPAGLLGTVRLTELVVQ